MTAAFHRIARWLTGGDLASIVRHRYRTEALARTIATRPKAHHQ